MSSVKTDVKSNLLPERLKTLRKEKKLTQQQLADKLGLISVTYLRYEKGQREPSIDTLMQIATFFEVSIDYLVGLSDY